MVPVQFDPWNNALGTLGLFDREDLGQGGCLAYVNVVTGKLVIPFRDAQLSEVAADLMPVCITYEQVGASAISRVKSVTDASGTQTFIYHGAVGGRGRTDLIDAEGQTWTYVYDAGTSQLLEVHSPSANGERPVATFHYDGEAMSLG